MPSDSESILTVRRENRGRMKASYIVYVYCLVLYWEVVHPHERHSSSWLKKAGEYKVEVPDCVNRPEKHRDVGARGSVAEKGGWVGRPTSWPGGPWSVLCWRWRGRVGWASRVFILRCFDEKSLHEVIFWTIHFFWEAGKVAWSGAPHLNTRED